MDELYGLIDNISAWMGISLNDDLREEIHFRVNDFDDTKEDKIKHIKACLRYVIENGSNALIYELDDGKVWDYV